MPCTTSLSWLVGGLLFWTPAAAADAFARIHGPAIVRQFAGMEVTDDVHWAKVFAKDGSYRSYALGVQRQGRWRVEKDLLCIERVPASDEPPCREVWMSGPRVQLRQPGMEIYDEGVLQRPIKRSLPLAAH